MIDPPNTPAFPAGHALQARLITRCLEMVVDPSNIPALNAPPTVTPLRFLADRIADNRVVAGLHFPRDNEAGVVVADTIFARLLRRGSFTTLVTAAQADLQPS